MHQCLGTDLDPDHHHDVPGAVRSGESIRRIPADHARYIHINLSRYFSGLRTAEDQYPPTEPNPVFRGTGVIYRMPGMVIQLDGTVASFLVFDLIRQHASFYHYLRIYHQRHA